jgi:hypothetical protein
MELDFYYLGEFYGKQIMNSIFSGKDHNFLGMVVHTCNPSTEAKEVD